MSAAEHTAASRRVSIAIHAAAATAICLLAGVLYWNSLHVPFVLDDRSNIVENRFIRLMTLDAARMGAAAFESPSSGRPVANLSFALNFYAGDYDVRGYHAVNVALHAANGVLVYALALFLLRRRKDTSLRGREGGLALLAALVFVAHPLQTQSVTYVVQRMTSLAALFYLLALLLYLAGRTARGRGARTGAWLAALVAWALALGSKQTAAVLPATILATEWYFFRDLDGRWLLRNLGAVAGVVGVAVSMAFVYLGASPLEELSAFYAERDFTLGERLLTQPRVVLTYVGLVLYPHPGRLSLVHDVAVSRSLFDPATTLPALAALAGIALATALLARRERLVSFCLLWFLLHLALESSFLPLELMFEHRLYLPLVGVAVLTVDLLYRALVPRYALVSAVLVIALLGAGTVWRNQLWRNPLAFWADAAAKAPNHPRAHAGYARELLRHRRFDEAIEQYAEAARLNPNRVELRRFLGAALARQGKIDEAAAEYREALRIAPDDVALRGNLAQLLLRRGELEEAARQANAALALDPDNAALHLLAGDAFARRGRHAEALSHYEAVLRLAPANTDVHGRLAATRAALAKPPAGAKAP